MTAEHWETIRAILILLGGLATGVVTSKTVRKSQRESSQITLATDLINQVQEERDSKATDLRSANLTIDQLRSEATNRERKWRNYTRRLRAQIYKLGGEPIEPDEDLGI
jgi:hypothetical protein